MICNYLGKIIPAIQSRCTRFRFAPLSRDQMMPRIEHVVKEEGISIDPGGMDLLLRMAEGDMRRSLNILQASHMAFGNVTEDIVYKVIFKTNISINKIIGNIIGNWSTTKRRYYTND